MSRIKLIRANRPSAVPVHVHLPPYAELAQMDPGQMFKLLGEIKASRGNMAARSNAHCGDVVGMCIEAGRNQHQAITMRDCLESQTFQDEGGIQRTFIGPFVVGYSRVEIMGGRVTYNVNRMRVLNGFGGAPIIPVEQVVEDTESFYQALYHHRETNTALVFSNVDRHIRWFMTLALEADVKDEWLYDLVSEINQAFINVHTSAGLYVPATSIIGLVGDALNSATLKLNADDNLQSEAERVNGFKKLTIEFIERELLSLTATSLLQESVEKSALKILSALEQHRGMVTKKIFAVVGTATEFQRNYEELRRCIRCRPGGDASDADPE